MRGPGTNKFMLAAIRSRKAASEARASTSVGPWTAACIGTMTELSLPPSTRRAASTAARIDSSNEQTYWATRAEARRLSRTAGQKLPIRTPSNLLFAVNPASRVEGSTAAKLSKIWRRRT